MNQYFMCNPNYNSSLETIHSRTIIPIPPLSTDVFLFLHLATLVSCDESNDGNLTGDIFLSPEKSLNVDSAGNHNFSKSC